MLLVLLVLLAGSALIRSLEELLHQKCSALRGELDSTNLEKKSVVVQDYYKEEYRTEVIKLHATLF